MAYSAGTPLLFRRFNIVLWFLFILCSLAFVEAAAGQSVTINNLSHPAISPNLRVGDNYSVVISGAAPGQAVGALQTSDGTTPTGTPYIFGYTDSNGNYVISGTQTQSSVGSYIQIWYLDSTPIAQLSFFVTAAPVVAVANLTHPAMSPNFDVGDNLQVTVVGPPNQSVGVIQIANGGTPPASPYIYGTTNGSGEFVITGTEDGSALGFFTQVWSVGDVQASPIITFMVAQLTGGTVTSTYAGETPDGHVEGVSTLTISGSTLNTYSITQLDCAASAYYDAGYVATLFQNGTEVAQHSGSGSGHAGVNISGPSTQWDDYDLQTDHYVIAYFAVDGYYLNPFYYGEGTSCDSDGDCSWDPGSGDYYIVEVAIYLGSTLADQTNVPQDATDAPLSSSSFLNSFLAASQPANASDVLFKVDTWDKAIKAAIPAIFLAESAYAQQGHQYDYPLPLFLELVKDTQSDGGTSNAAALRTRTYVVKDTTGRHWQGGTGAASKPIAIYENLSYVSGAGAMPIPNNPANGGGGWKNTNEIDTDGLMDDRYGEQTIGQPQVNFIQQYWATGFAYPNLALPTVPGVSNIANVNGPVVPLFIRDRLSHCITGDFGSQGVSLNQTYIGVNGDSGPNTPCLH